MTLPLLGPMTLSGFAHAWFFLFLLLFNIVVSSRGAAATPAQRAFRLALTGIGLLGLVTVWAIKAVFKRKAP